MKDLIVRWRGSAAVGLLTDRETVGFLALSVGWDWGRLQPPPWFGDRLHRPRLRRAGDPLGGQLAGILMAVPAGLVDAW